MEMQNRIVELTDGYKFVDVTDLAVSLWDTDIELFELDDEGVEHLIQSGKELERAIQTGMVVVERQVGESLGLV